MFLLGRFETGASIGENVLFQNAFFLKQVYGSIHRCDRDAGIDGGCTPMQFNDIGVVDGFRQNAHDDFARACQPKPVLLAKGNSISIELHESTYILVKL